MGRDFGGELGGCVLQGRSARSGFGVRFHPAKSGETQECPRHCAVLTCMFQVQKTPLEVEGSRELAKANKYAKAKHKLLILSISFI